MKTFLSALAVLVAGLTSFQTAQAHPHHFVSPAEKFTTFKYKGKNLNVWNTHNRGLFGAELIEIRDYRGKLYASWWTTQGWCFTGHVMEHGGCWSKSGYVALFKARINKVDHSKIDFSGSGGAAGSTDFCDHYSQLEYTVSGDTSGICDHEDGLALPDWDIFDDD